MSLLYVFVKSEKLKLLIKFNKLCSQLNVESDVN